MREGIQDAGYKMLDTGYRNRILSNSEWSVTSIKYPVTSIQ